jgi:hypothetical protein
LPVIDPSVYRTLAETPLFTDLLPGQPAFLDELVECGFGDLEVTGEFLNGHDLTAIAVGHRANLQMWITSGNYALLAVFNKKICNQYRIRTPSTQQDGMK